MVFVIVVSKNRKEGFEAIKEAVERYKSEPALWKKEVYINGSYEWVREVVNLRGVTSSPSCRA